MVQVQKLSFIYSSSPSTFQVDRESTVSADVCFAKYYSCLLSHGKFRMRRWRMDPGNEDSRRKGTDPFNDNLNHCNTVSESIELRFLIFNFRKRFITILIFGMTWIPTKFLGGETGFDAQEAKLPTYWSTPFSKICLGMKIGPQTKFTVINKNANSLYSLIADGHYRATSLGRNTWKTLIGSHASLQHNCNKEGFNVVDSSFHSKARIGIISNNGNDRSGCDSRIGFGTGGYPDDSNTCGNEAKHSADNGDKHIKAMGYILVQWDERPPRL